MREILRVVITLLLYLSIKTERWQRYNGVYMFDKVKVGDVVTRMLAGTIPMALRVTEITVLSIICGDYTFDKVTGAEIDDYLNWGPPPLMTGSFLKPPKQV
jgi:hypothetical protein